MNEMRLAFLAAAGAARPLLAAPEAGDRWLEPSALRELTVGGLAGHLVGSVVKVEENLDRPVPADEISISAAAYYASVVDTDDISAPVHVGIRQRGEQAGAMGQAALLDHFDRTLLRQRARFADETEDRRVKVSDELVMDLDDYLATRIVELTLHTDDLCVSVGHELPHLPGTAITIATLIDVARHRHGDVAIIRGLARRERDPVGALRVL
ncbi:MAG: maleylpyruvate isomerase N-terminal domain-containing protein [Candidatus Dormibacteria bacterium]